MFIFDLFNDNSGWGTSSDDSGRSTERSIFASTWFHWYNNIGLGWGITDTFDDEVVLEVILGEVDSGASESLSSAWFSVDEDFPSGTSSAELNVGVDNDSEERSWSFGLEVASLEEGKTQRILLILKGSTFHHPDNYRLNCFFYKHRGGRSM